MKKTRLLLIGGFIYALIYTIQNIPVHAQDPISPIAVNEVTEPVSRELGEVLGEKENRVAILQSYLESKNSPLAPYSQTFIEVADQYGYDWTLLPSITFSESGGGRVTPSCAPFNPFGWTSTTSPCGHYRFTSFDESIRFVAERLSSSRAYTDFQRTKKLEDIAKNYNKVGTAHWTAKVIYFQEEIKEAHENSRSN